MAVIILVVLVVVFGKVSCLAECPPCSCNDEKEFTTVNCEKVTLVAPNRNMGDVSHLYVFQSNVSAEFLSGLPRTLTHLHIVNSRVSGLDRDIFGNFTKLEVFEMKRIPGLKEIPLISKNSKLEHIDLSENDIEYLPDYFFSEHANLDLIFLIRNRIEMISNRSFLSNKKITRLDLSWNSIREIEPGSFHVSQVRKSPDGHFSSYINVSNNIIEQVYGNTFPSPNVTHLNMMSNRIRSLHPDSFAGLASLRHLLLGNNLLTSLPRDVFKTLKSLERIDVSDNSISAIEVDDFSSLENLRELLLNGNRIKFVHRLAFGRLKSLAYLDVSGNLLESLEWALAPSLPELTHLNLSANGMRTLSRSAFGGCPSLEVLDLSGNDLDKLELQPFSTLLKLRWLALRLHDSAECDCRLFERMRNLTVDLTVQGPLGGKCAEYLSAGSEQDRPLCQDPKRTEESNPWVIATCVLSAVVLVLLGVMFLIYRRPSDQQRTTDGQQCNTCRALLSSFVPPQYDETSQ